MKDSSGFMRGFFLGLVIGFGMGVLLFATDADASYRPALVVQDESAITCNGWGWRDNALEVARELGTQTIRVNMFQWRTGCDSDSAVNAIAAAGMKPQLTLAGSTGYMTAKVRAHRAQVSTYTIWNEPELGVFRCCSAPFLEQPGMKTASRYRARFPSMYRMVKREDPGAKVCWGEHSPMGMGGYLKRALRKTRRPVRADCLAVHPYHWVWSLQVDRKYFRALGEFKRLVGRLARERRLCRPATPRGRPASSKKGCRPVPIYSTEAGQPLWDGQDGDAAAAVRAYRYCAKLKFRQCAQYQIFPGFNAKHSPQAWNTGLTDLNCQPTATFYALRKALTGRTGLARVRWPECPKPTPASEPLPPGWGTPAAPPLPPTPPPVVEEVPEEELPDQLAEEIPEPVEEEPAVVEPEPVVEEAAPDEGEGL